MATEKNQEIYNRVKALQAEDPAKSLQAIFEDVQKETGVKKGGIASAYYRGRRDDPAAPPSSRRGRPRKVEAAAATAAPAEGAVAVAAEATPAPAARRRGPAKRTAAKKAPAKKAVAAKAPARKAPAKKAPAKRATPVRRTRVSSVASNGGSSDAVAVVQNLVAENQRLERENADLRSRLDRVAAATR